MRAEGRQEEARELLEAELARVSADNPFRFWLACTLAEIERDEERWQAARELLALARRDAFPEEGPQTAQGGVHARTWLLGLEGELWLDLGLPDRAAPLFAEERDLVDALDPPDVQLARAALDHRLRLLLAEDDFDGLAEVEERLASDRAHLDAPAWWQAKVDVRFAVGALEAELRGVAPAGAARERLEGLVAGGDLDPVEERWTHLHLALAQLDEPDLAAAADTLASLRALLAGADGATPTRPHHRLALGLVALEARHALLVDGAGGTPPLPLAEHAARLRAAWNDGFLARWAEAPVRSGGLGYLYLSYRHLVAQELLELHLRLDGPEDGPRAVLGELLRAQALGTLARRLGADIPSLAEVRSGLLTDGAGLLLWHVGRDRSYVVLADAQGVACERLAPVHVLERAARGLVVAAQRALRSGRGDDLAAVESAAREARDALLPAAWRGRIEGWSAALVTGLDGLGYVPFELLPGGSGARLGAQLEVVHLPSVPVGLRLAERAPEGRAARRPEDTWVLADTLGPRPDLERWELPPLDLGLADLAPLMDAADGHGRLESGTAASPAALERALSAGAPVVQVVAHGLYDPTRERPAGLLLAPDTADGGALWADDIERLVEAAQVPPRLTVLTACGTARGPLRRGDDGRGDLGAAFLAAGADAVVLSAAPQERDAGLRIAAALHRELAGGASPAAALRRVREECATRGSDLEALQAGLIHSLGAGRRPVFAASMPPARQSAPPPWAALGLGAVLALGAGAWLLVRARRAP